MEGFFDRSAPNIEHAIAIANATSSSQKQSGKPGKPRPAIFAFLWPKTEAQKLHRYDHKKDNPESSSRFSPITPEPAPSLRLRASARARPFADGLTLTRH